MKIKKLLIPIAVLLVGVPSISYANINIKGVDVTAGSATVKLESDREARGYLTVLEGANKSCGSIIHIVAGQNGRREPAYRQGSLDLKGNLTASYTVPNLAHDASYTLCATNGIEYKRYSFITPAVAEYSAPVWEEIPLEAEYYANNSSLTFAPDGTFYIPTNIARNTATTKILNYKGDTWNVIEGMSNFAGFLSALAFSPTGELHILTSYLAYTGPLYLYRQEEEGWVGTLVENMLPSGSGLSSFKLAFSHDGTAYFSYLENSGNGIYKIKVKKFDGQNSVYVGDQNLLGPVKQDKYYYYVHSYRPNLIISSDGLPIVTFITGDQAQQAKVMKFDGNNWMSIGESDLTDTNILASVLTMAPDGSLYLAYKTPHTSPTSPYTSTTVKRFNGSNWVEVKDIPNTPTSSELNIAISPDGAPYLMYYAHNGVPPSVENLKLVKFDGENWVNVANNFLPELSTLKEYNNFALSPDGTPYATFTNTNYQLEVMRIQNSVD